MFPPIIFSAFLALISRLERKEKQFTAQKCFWGFLFREMIQCVLVMINIVVIGVQSLIHVLLFATSWTVASQTPLSSTFSIYSNSCPSEMLSNHLILCCSLLLLSSVFPRIRVFPIESALPIRWPKYWSFSFSNRSSNEYSGLISFGVDWFDLAVQGTLKSLPQQYGQLSG